MKIFLVTVAVLFLQLPMFAQDLEQRVTIKEADIPLELLLKKLAKQYHIRFSYGYHREALGKKVSIQAEGQELSYFLTLLLGKAGLSYKVMGGYVVLRKDQEQLREKEDSVVVEASAGKERISLKQEDVREPSHELGPGMRPGTVAWPQKRGLVAFISADTVFKVVPVRIPQRSPLPLKKEASAFILGPVFSFDFLRFQMESAYEVNQELHPESGWSAGGAGFWRLLDRMMAEMQLLYRKKDFTVLYLLSTEGEPIGIPEKTKISLAYVEVPLSMHFSLLRYRQFSLHGASGIFGSLLLKKQETTWLDDGRLFPTANMHIPLLSGFLWGGRGGLDINYSLNSKLFFSVAPSYQFSINPLKKGTQQIRLREFTVRTSVRIRL